MIKILTPSGWSNFSGIKKTKNRSTISINGLTCTPEHLIKIDGKFVEARAVPYSIASVTDVYDILDVELNHEYYTNGFVSHNCCFRGSQNSLLNAEITEKLVTKAPIDELNDVKIYKEPNPSDTYVACCDVSRGVGKDFHAMSIVNISSKPYEVVATYRNNKLSPLLYPNLIFNIANHYNEAHVLVELNDNGQEVANILYYDLEYENVLMTVTDKNRQIIGFSENSKPGVKTSVATKSIGVSTIKTMVEKEKIVLNDMDIINEFGTFVPRGKSWEADKGAHDDMVMTLVLFAWLTTQVYFIELTDENFREQLLREQEEQSMESICPFGIIDNDFGEYTGENSSHDYGFF